MVYDPWFMVTVGTLSRTGSNRHSRTKRERERKKCVCVCVRVCVCERDLEKEAEEEEEGGKREEAGWNVTSGRGGMVI